MPANKNALSRYKILDDLLSNRYHNYSLDDLTEEVNNRLSECGLETVVRRTIEKDIDYLEYSGLFDVDIEHYSVGSYDYDKQKNCMKRCLRYEDPSFSIFKKELTKDEEYLLSETLSMLGQFDGLPNLEDLEKLRIARGAQQQERQIISFAKNPLIGSTNIFGELFTAISQKQVIELHYHKFSSKRGMVINLHPYLLKEYNHRWFLIAATENDKTVLNFALDRIDKIVPLPSHKYIEYDGEINALFEDIIGVTFFKDSPIFKIVFWVSDASKDYVLTKPLHESQRTLPKTKESELMNQYPTLSGGLFFQIECKNNYELIRELSSFGKDLLVLCPKVIQSAVWNRICEMKEEYMKIM